MTEKEKQLFQERLKKLEGLKKAGIDPYPSKTERTHRIEDLMASFEAHAKGNKKVVVAGRVRAIRGHGAIMFGTLDDGSGTFQFILKKDSTPHTAFELFTKFVDIGDFVEVSGVLMTTQRGEKSLLASSLKILTKSLRALPDKWHGVTDRELRLRKRYLDLLASPETRALFVKKALFWNAVRRYMTDANFLEVEMPVLEHIPGGAEAEPFVTHHKALDEDFYLRISLELPLKRLLVGGYEKVFEIGRIFRNEGISTEHLQDYTQMEFYWAYADFEDLQKFLQGLYRAVIKELFGSLKVKSQGREIDWGASWQIYDYFELFQKHTGLDLAKLEDSELRKKADSLKLKYKKSDGRGRLIDLIYKKTVRPHLIAPGFLVYPPVAIEPLAKRVPGEPDKVQRLQVMAWGTELGKGFGELNDPLDQRERFEEQMRLREAGDKEAQQLDADYLEAMEYGMPPMAGFGLSERLFAVLMDKSIRETVLFPPMREVK